MHKRVLLQYFPIINRGTPVCTGLPTPTENIINTHQDIQRHRPRHLPTTTESIINTHRDTHQHQLQQIPIWAQSIINTY